MSRPQRKAVTRSRKALGAQADACPAGLLFCEREDNRLFGNLAALPEIEKQHQRIPFAQQRLRVRKRKRLRIGQLRVIGEGLAQRGLLLRKLGLDLRNGGARRFRGLGVGLARRRIEPAIGGLARAQQILLLAHEPRQAPGRPWQTARP